MRLSKTYDSSKYESEIYALWEKKRAFEPKNRGGDGYFSLVAPPPNANANLHIGYGYTIAIEDTLARYHRMQGREALFVPGADHAGFETWVVYEKKLAEQGKSRFDFSREELYRQVWEFVEKNKENLQSQIRALGASVDWSKFTYTLDNKVVTQAYETFQKMWHEGLIYRGKRIVNFCTFHGTSFADIEVVHEQEKTKLWYIAYPLADGTGEVVIATTRPETKLGQSALMVNPKDDRYKHLVGREVNQPLVPDKPIKIIADDYVDMQFGTGVVTVTPAHDPNDFEVAQRHSLPVIELITAGGKMSDNVPAPFRGLTVPQAREAVAKALETGNYLRKIEDYIHSIGKCYKCGTPIEPLLREQWFVKMQPLAGEAIKVLSEKKIKFYPDSKRTQLIKYLESLKDWNISRQIAWGIPIPAFQNAADQNDWVFDARVNQETIEKNGKTYRRDPDVFDTWFSSSSWPYVTLNYPDGDDFRKFYPLSLMETGGEILYPWVSRMIMMGLYETGKIPFKEVYIHGYVLAESGAKMSKSLGNVIDPVDAIGSYGSDAVRMGLLAGRAAGVNRGYDPRRVEEARNFCNKLWNIARFIENQGADSKDVDHKPQSIADHWILNQLSICISEVNKALSQYRLSEAYEEIYHFVWNDLADWYVEASKVESNPPFSRFILEKTLELVHPFAPFISETIWQTMGGDEDNLLMTQTMGDISVVDKVQAKEFQEVITVVAEIRRISSVLGVKGLPVQYSKAPPLAAHAKLVQQLGRTGQVSEIQGQGQGLRLTSSNYAVWLGLQPAQAQNYASKLTGEKKVREGAISRLEGRLASKEYTHKAPKELVEQTKHQLEEEKIKLAAIEKDLLSIQIQ